MTFDDVVATGTSGLAEYLLDAATEGSIDLDTWLRAPYVPLPTLVEAARRIFAAEPLPHVKRALAAEIPETVDLIRTLIEQAREESLRILVFLTGVPGSGKTLVGLRVVYEGSEDGTQATFLSGNGPLVQVLQDALRSSVFVRDLHRYIRSYGINERQPRERIIVFDEAQRAWDADYMQYNRSIHRSEPEFLVGIGSRIEPWAAMVGLVGEGQEIYSGEEGGMAQWAGAVQTRPPEERWRVHCSPRVAPEFADVEIITSKRLDLTVSLRSRRAEFLHRWVQHVLEGSLALAARLAMTIQNDAYPMYMTRDLDEARDYARTRYPGEREKRFGLVASSHAKSLPRHGVDNSWMATSRLKVARWFNAPYHDPASCCALEECVTEFQCQGLELDLPIVCWGEDMRWDGSAWVLSPIRRRYPIRDPKQLLRNTYRVLLTRGRDGLVVYLPPSVELDQTEHALLAAGVRPLPEIMEQVEEAGA